MPKTLNVFAPICYTGYGVHAINFIATISKKYNVALFPIGQVQYEGKHSEVISRAIANQDNFDSSNPSIKLWHDVEMATFAGNPRIAYTVFELDKISPRGVKHLNSCDKIVTASKWGVQTLIDNGLPADKLFVINEGVDEEIFPWTPHIDDRDMRLQQKLRVLNIGKFEKRKGHLSILDAIRYSTTPVSMTAHWFNPFLDNKGILKAITENGWTITNPEYRIKDVDANFICLKPDIGQSSLFLCLSLIKSSQEIAALYRNADVGLFPHFAEGWNLPLIEAMASGLPCITQSYSGPSEYLTPDNHIEIRGKMAKAHDSIWFNGQGSWSEISSDAIIGALWQADNDRKLLETISYRLKDFGKQWSWKQTLNQLDMVLSK